MVRRNRVDRPVQQPFDQGRTVRLAAQRRVHLCIGVVASDRLVRQQQVVRRDFRGHAHAAPLGLPDQRHAPGGTDVGHVQPGACVLGEHDVSSHDGFFADRRDSAQAQHDRPRPLMHRPAVAQRCVLAVFDDRQSDLPRIAHRPPQQPSVLHGIPIIRERHRPRGRQRGNRCQLLAQASLGDGRDWQDAAGAGAGSAPLDIFHNGRMVDRRDRVGHAGHGGEPALHGGHGPRRDILLMRLTRIAEVHVHVHQAGRHEKVVRINDAMVAAW